MSSFRHNLLLLVAIIITLIVSATCTVEQQEQEYWFTQKLDHYNAQDTRTFQQRYFVFNHQPESSTVLLYICGEGPCPSTPFNYVRNYAQQLGATLYTVEHRYYGKSIPQLFSDLSTPNLKYLSSQQALADLAHFIQTTNKSNNQKKKKQQYHWISVGCSYPGALSAWLRYKYPHLIMGALSSSGVVNTIVDFPQFDHRVYLSSGVKCGTVLRRVTLAMERQMLPPYNQGQLIKQLFRWKDNMNKSNDTLLNNGDFFFLMADAAAESIQYGFHEELCSVMEPWYTKYVDIVDDIKLIESFAQFVTSSYYVNFGEDSPLEYTTYFASQTSLANSDASVRQWNYQVCSEFGYLQNMPLNSSVAIRSHFINNAYQMHKCNVMFQNQLPSTQILFPTQPVAKKTFDQMYYGGKELRTHKKRVIYANGSQDPWLEASVSSEHDGFLMVHCENCGHCVDLRGCPSLPNGDSGVNEKCMGNGNQLAQQARSIILQQFKQWIQEEEEEQQ